MEDENNMLSGLRGTGQSHKVEEAKGQLPVKQPGKHRFVITCMYVPHQDPLVLMDPTITKHLDSENLHSTGVGCIDCEMPIDQAVRFGCPASDAWERDQ